MAAGMSISKLAKAAGVGIETVRYYQRRGLLPVPRPYSRSYREYDEAFLERLLFIRRLQAGGFTLREIKELIQLNRGTDRIRIQEIAARKLDELNRQIRVLRLVAKDLKSLVAQCRDASQGTPCPIIEAFDA